jgi:hypothetical protein
MVHGPKDSRAAVRARQERVRREAALTAPQGAQHDGDGPKRIGRGWRRTFLIALGQTSDIGFACKASGASIELAYSARREELDFAIAWRRALLEGYENLELETLYFLRTGQPPFGDSKFDVLNAIRLIKGQADAAARARAAREEDDEQEVLDSIDRMLDGMRERAAANTAILQEGADEEPGE